MAGPVAAPPPRLPPGVGPRKRRLPASVKLWSLVVLANLAGFLVAVWVARLIRAGTPSEGTESALLAAYYGTMILIGLCDGLLLDELLFNGAFRKTHLQGKRARFAKADEDVREVATLMQRSTASFPFLVLLGVIVTYFTFNLLNRDFDTYYKFVGKYASVLRSQDPARRQARLDAIAALSVRRMPEVLPILLEQLARGGDEAAWAAWALGRHTDLPRPQRLWPPLVQAARTGSPAVRREALVALGRLQNRGMAPQIQALIASDLDAGRGVDARLVYGLGAIQVTSSIDVLTRVLHEGDETAQRVAAWALAQHRDQRGGRAVVDVLHARLPSATLPVRCAIVHALGIVGDERSNLALMAAFDQASATERNTICPLQEIAMRPDGKDDAVVILLPQDIYSFKIIQSMGQMRATTPSIRAQVEPWLTAVAANEAHSAATRVGAENLLKGIREGRDDRGLKTAEELYGPG